MFYLETYGEDLRFENDSVTKCRSTDQRPVDRVTQKTLVTT